ncbi:MAG TPA: hypothetical protein VMU30_05575 [Bacteroidota bacterium]|nr:hypothetical protein [Bacteroidota bacterium]
MPIEELKEKLMALYGEQSKHSHYQNVPEFVKKSIGYSEIINEEWRGDTARYRYIVHEVEQLKPGSICDIGANTGFFSLSLANKFPNLKITAFEGNPVHVEFINLIKDAFSIGNVELKNRYVDYESIDNSGHYDLMLHLNVLHHAGVDFDTHLVNYNSFEDYAVKYFEKLKTVTNTLVFQMGFHYGGNKTLPIIKVSDDVGKILFIRSIYKRVGWRLRSVAYINRNAQGELEYRNAPKQIIDAIEKNDTATSELVEYITKLHLDAYSEFYRRPIFIFD